MKYTVLITGITGAQLGDQLRAYDSEDKLVGSINIVQEHLDGQAIDLVVHKAVSMPSYGIEIEGSINGLVTLKLYKAIDDTEYAVETEFDAAVGNVSEFSLLGDASINDQSVNATSIDLGQNYPNPFNPTTMINYNVAVDGHVTLKVYDIMGRLVKTLVNDYRTAGNASGYSAFWDGTDNFGSEVSAGLYIYTLQTNENSMTKKMVLMK